MASELEAYDRARLGVRVLSVIALAAGTAWIALASLDVVVTDQDYLQHVEVAAPLRSRVVCATAMMPFIWCLATASRRAVMCTAVSSIAAALAGRFPVRLSWLGPPMVEVGLFILAGAIGLIAVVLMPALRLTVSEPPAPLPPARIQL